MEVALFPLHAVLFPGATLPLQIFEARYRAMLDAVLAADRRFGIAAIRLGMEVGGPAETYPVGCMASIEQMRRTEGGPIELSVTGRERFRIVRRLPDDPYPRALVEPSEEEAGDDAARALADARAALRRYLSVVAKIQGSEIVAPPLPEDPVGASHAIAAALQVDLPERQRLLGCEDAAARLTLAADLARREALLLEALGPSVGHPPRGTHSLN